MQVQVTPKLSSSARNALLAHRRRPLYKKMLDTLLITPLREWLVGLRIHFVPACIPLRRRLQVLGTASWMFMMLVIPAFFIFLCSFPPLWPPITIYLLWAYLIDDCAQSGGRPSEWVRSLGIWQYIVDYFSISLVKEADLPPDKPYIFGYHPHGLFAFGAQATFGTNLTGFSTAFPGIRPHLLTLTINLSLPLYREILLLLGGSTASRKSCTTILSSSSSSRSGDGDGCQGARNGNVKREGGGGGGSKDKSKSKCEAIALVVGGAEESLSARWGTVDLVLRKRLGFLKVAIRTGAGLVPCFGFGENDLFYQVENEKGSRVYGFQKRFKSVFGFASPFVYGRGLLNYNFGLVPFRKPITVVVGRPISVNQMDEPTQEEIERVQRLYIEELTRIWDTYKDKFAPDRIRELRIIE